MPRLTATITAWVRSLTSNYSKPIDMRFAFTDTQSRRNIGIITILCAIERSTASSSSLSSDC